MSLLTETPPVRVELGGVSVPICADFRVLLRIDALREQALDDAERGRQALRLFYGGGIPADAAQAAQQLLWFLRCGQDAPQTMARTPSKAADFSFVHDAPLLYAAFLDQYGVDLCRVDFLHWWQFRALLEGLRDDHKFCEVRRCRSVELGGVKDQSLRRYYREMQKRYALPMAKAQQAQLDALTAALLGDGDIKTALGGAE